MTMTSSDALTHRLARLVVRQEVERHPEVVERSQIIASMMDLRLAAHS